MQVKIANDQVVADLVETEVAAIEEAHRLARGIKGRARQAQRPEGPVVRQTGEVALPTPTLVVAVDREGKDIKGGVAAKAASGQPMAGKELSAAISLQSSLRLMTLRLLG
jgi:hypothetical protein